jgi:DNA modification methylase
MQVGEVVDLGPHRLVCGDAFNPEHVDLLMQGDEADMVYCDPPYGIDFTGNHAKRYDNAKAMATVREYEYCDDSKPLDIGLLVQAFRSCKEQFWWGANNYSSLIPNIERGSWIVWDKRVDAKLDNVFGSAFELCWSRTRHSYRIARVKWAGFHGMNDPIDRPRQHPAQRPVALAEWFLDRYSKEGATVVDLFGGSGSTLLACERKNRVCRMAELSPQYCDVIIQRYEQMTQQPALIA